jgi:hypothetical protein
LFAWKGEKKGSGAGESIVISRFLGAHCVVAQQKRYAAKPQHRKEFNEVFKLTMGCAADVH